MFTRNFIVALKLNTKPMYQLAQQCSIHPNDLSKWIHGIKQPRRDDPRLLKLADLVGVSHKQIFNPGNNIE
jgi:hypothetical protein